MAAATHQAHQRIIVIFLLAGSVLLLRAELLAHAIVVGHIVSAQGAEPK